MANYTPVEARKTIIDKGGTVIHSGLVPTEPGAPDSGTATHYAIFGKGGYKSVPTKGDLNDLSNYPARLEEGMLVYVEEDEQIYQLKKGYFVPFKISTTIIIDSSSLSLPIYKWFAYTNDPVKADASVYLYPPEGESFRYIGTAENMSMSRDEMKRFYEDFSNGSQVKSSLTYSELLDSIADHLVEWDAINEDIDDILMPVGSGGQRRAVPAASLFEWTDQVQNGRELNDYMMLVESNRTFLSDNGDLSSTVKLTIMHQENDGTYSKVTSIGNDSSLVSICTNADGDIVTQNPETRISENNSDGIFTVVSTVPGFGSGGGSAQIEICLIKNPGTPQKYKVGQVIIPVGATDSSIIEKSVKYTDDQISLQVADTGGKFSAINIRLGQIESVVADSSTRYSSILQELDKIRLMIVDTSTGLESLIQQKIDEVKLMIKYVDPSAGEPGADTSFVTESELTIKLGEIEALVSQLRIDASGDFEFLNSFINQTATSIESKVNQLRIDVSGDVSYLSSRITQTASSIEATAREIALSTVQDYVKNLGTDTWIIFANKDPQNPANTDTVYTAQSNANSKFYGMKFGQTKTIWEKLDASEQADYQFTEIDASLLGIPSEFAWIALGENTNFGIDKTYSYSTLSQIVQWGMNKHLQVNFRYIVHKQTQDGYENVPASDLIGKVTVNYESGRISDTYAMSGSGYEIGLLETDGLKHNNTNTFAEFANRNDIVKDVRVNIWTVAGYDANSTVGNILSLSVQPTVVSGVIIDISNGLSTVIQDENGHYNELKTSIGEHKDWMDAAGERFAEIDASIGGIKTAITDLDSSAKSTIEQTAEAIRSTVADLSSGMYSKITQTANSIEGIAQNVAISTVDARLQSLGTDTWLVFATADPNDPNQSPAYTAQSNASSKFYGMKFGQSQTVWQKLNRPETSGYTFTASDCSTLGIPRDFAWISLGDDAMFLSSTYSVKAVSQVIQWSMSKTLQANLRYIVQEQTTDGYRNVQASDLVGKVTITFSNAGRGSEIFSMTASGYELSLYSTELKHTNLAFIGGLLYAYDPDISTSSGSNTLTDTNGRSHVISKFTATIGGISWTFFKESDDNRTYSARTSAYNQNSQNWSSYVSWTSGLTSKDLSQLVADAIQTSTGTSWTPTSGLSIMFADKYDQIDNIRIDIWTKAAYTAGSAATIFSTSIQPVVVSGVLVDISNGLKTVIQDSSAHYSEVKTAVGKCQTWIDASGVKLTEIEAGISGIRATVSDLSSNVSSRFSQVPGQIQAAVSDLSNGLNSLITQTASEIRSEVSAADSLLSSKIEQTASTIRTQVAADISNGLGAIGTNTWVIYSKGDPYTSGTNLYCSPTVTGITHSGVRYGQVKTMKEQLAWSTEPSTSTAALSAAAKTKLDAPNGFVWSLLKESEPAATLNGVYKLATIRQAACWDTSAGLRVGLTYLVKQQVAGSSNYEDVVGVSNLSGMMTVSYTKGGIAKTDTYTLSKDTSNNYLYFDSSALSHTQAGSANTSKYSYGTDAVTDINIVIKKSDNTELFKISAGVPSVQVGTVQYITENGITTAINGLDGRFESIETDISKIESWESSVGNKFTTIETGIDGISGRVTKIDSSIGLLISSGYFDVSAGGIKLGVQNTLNGQLSDTGIDIVNKKISLRADNVEFSNDVDIHGSLTGPKDTSGAYSYKFLSNGTGELGYGALSWDASTKKVTIGNVLLGAINSAATDAAEEAAITPKSYVIDCDTPIYVVNNPDTGTPAKRSITATLYEVSGTTRTKHAAYWFRNGVTRGSSTLTAWTWDQYLNDVSLGGSWDKITLTAAANSAGTQTLASFTITKVTDGKQGSTPSMSDVGYQYSISFVSNPSLVCDLDGKVNLKFSAKIVRTAQDGTQTYMSSSDSWKIVIAYGNTQTAAAASGVTYDASTAIVNKDINDSSAVLYQSGGVMLYAGQGTVTNICNKPYASMFIPLTFDSSAALSVDKTIKAVVKGFCGSSFTNWTADGITSGVTSYITNVSSQISQHADQIDLAVSYASTASDDASFVKNKLSSTGINISQGTITLKANKVTFCDSNGGNTDKIKIDPSTGTLIANNMQATGGKFTNITVDGNSTLNNVTVNGSYRTPVTAVSSSSGETVASSDCYILQDGAILKLPTGAENVGRCVIVIVSTSATATVKSAGALSVGAGAQGSAILSGQVARFRCISTGYWIMESHEPWGNVNRFGAPMSLIGVVAFNNSGIKITNEKSMASTYLYNNITCNRTATGVYVVKIPLLSCICMAFPYANASTSATLEVNEAYTSPITNTTDNSTCNIFVYTKKDGTLKNGSFILWIYKNSLDDVQTSTFN